MTKPNETSKVAAVPPRADGPTDPDLHRKLPPKRKQFEMSREQLADLIRLCGSKPYAALDVDHGNAAWAELGKQLGFVPATVYASTYLGRRFFTAEPAK